MIKLLGMEANNMGNWLDEMFGTKEVREEQAILFREKCKRERGEYDKQIKEQQRLFRLEHEMLMIEHRLRNKGYSDEEISYMFEKRKVDEK